MPSIIPALVEHYMTPSPRLIDRSETVGGALKLMKAHSIRHLPVVEDGKLLGIVSERDLELACNFPQLDVHRISVEQVMVFDPLQVEPHTPLERVVAEMFERKLGSAVITKGGEPIGVFTTTDALFALSKVFRWLSADRQL